MGTGTIVHDRGARVERNANAQSRTASRTGKIARASLVSEVQTRVAKEAEQIMNTTLPPRRRVRYTEDDPTMSYRTDSRRYRRMARQHSPAGTALLFLGIGLLSMLLIGICLNVAINWVLGHISDPLTYGQWHGNRVEFMMNKQNVSVYSLNNHGKILLFEVLPNGQTKPIATPTVYANDPDSVIVQVEVVDANTDGIPDIAMHVMTPEIEGLLPFKRHSVGDLVIYGNKDGSFTQNRPTSK